MFIMQAQCARAAHERNGSAMHILRRKWSLGKAECVVLRGPNGSCKTTLLRIFAATLPQSKGQATLDGSLADERNDLTRTAIPALIGASATYRHLTLIDHMVSTDPTWGRLGEFRAHRPEEVLELLEFDHLAQRCHHELSSGQQLFHLPIVPVRPSSMLILDELEKRLDTDKHCLLTRILLERKTDGTGPIIACRDPAMTVALADIAVIQPA